jgi:hypothetical protein
MFCKKQNENVISFCSNEITSETMCVALTLLECENLWRHSIMHRCTSARQNTNLQIATIPTKSENNNNNDK